MTDDDFVTRHWHQTHRLARERARGAGDRGDLAAVTSDALLGLLRAARTYRDDGARSETSWVHYCVQHAITDGFRARNGDPRYGPRSSVTHQPWDDHPRLVHQDDLDALHNRVDLHHALRTLDDREQVAIEAYYWDGWTLAQLGVQFGLTESGVSLVLKRARAKLRRALAA